MNSKFSIFLSLFLMFLVLSCSSSDDIEQNTNNNPTLYMPLHSGNYWTYDVTNQTTAGTTNFRDSLYIGNDTLINSISYKKMKTLNLPNGFYCNSLRNNGLRVDGSKIKISGAVNFSAGLPTPLTFSVSDFAIMKENGNVGEELSSTSGSFSQNISGYPLTFEYTLKSVSDGAQSTFISGSTTFSNITKTKIILNLKITTTQTVGGIPFTLTVMNAQDVVTSTQYYCKNIGVVYNNTLINYTLNSLPGVTLPIPSSGSQTQVEYLDTYLAN